MAAGALLLAVAAVPAASYVPDGGVLITGGPPMPNQSDLVRAFAPRAAVVPAFLLVFGLMGGWLLAGRMLAPLHRITDATRIAANGSLSHRIHLEAARTSSASSRTASTPCSRDSRRTTPNSKDLQPTPPTNCAPRWRSPRRCSTSPAATPTATPASWPNASAPSTPARSTTEALLLLELRRLAVLHLERVDLSPIAEEAAETLMPVAGKHGVTIHTSGRHLTVGSHALLLQMVTNLAYRHRP